MSTTYPTTKQSIPNPTGTDLLENAIATLDHDYQHSTLNDTIEALQDKVGVDGSAVTTTHDYKLSGVTGSDKAVSKTGTETLTNKTLTAPQINMGSDATGDMYYRNASGVTTRLPIGTASQTIQVSASGIPEWIANPAASDASTTVKGVVEEATQAETLARTAAGGTSARLFVNPTTLTTVKTYDYAASSGGTDAYAITVTPAPVAYVVGQTFTFKADVANAGPATLNVNGLGAITIKKNASADLDTGDIVANQIVVVIYDASNNFQLVSSRGTFSGYEIVTGTDTVNFNSVKIANITLNAPSGKKIVGGGWRVTATGNQSGFVGMDNGPTDTTGASWNVQVRASSGTTDATVTAYAICMPVTV